MNTEEPGVFEYVFDQVVRADQVERYYEFSERLKKLAAEQEGFVSQEREVVNEGGKVWKFRTTLKFDTVEHCVAWLDDPERRRLLRAEEAEAGFAFEGHGNWEGYGRWLSRAIASQPPKWKVNVLVLLMLYPTVMALTPLLHLTIGDWSMPAVMLVSNALCVAATSWVLVPFASRVYAQWLEGTLSPMGRVLAGSSLVALIGGMLLVFKAVPVSFWG